LKGKGLMALILRKMDVNKYPYTGVVIFLCLIERNIAFESWEKLYRGAEWCEMHPFNGLSLSPLAPARPRVYYRRADGRVRSG
jgi:hypothetical protein